MNSSMLRYKVLIGSIEAGLLILLLPSRSWLFHLHHSFFFSLKSLFYGDLIRVPSKTESEDTVNEPSNLALQGSFLANTVLTSVSGQGHSLVA